MPTPRSLGKSARPIYSRIKRISLYPQHAALKSFFTELETLPNDIANEALLQAIGFGAEQALRDARRKVKRRGRGLPDVVDELQLSLLDASAE